jgi:subtilase family serine protease
MKRIAALAVAAVPLLAAASRPPLPDITSAVVVGSNTTITMRIRNQGTAPSPVGRLNVSLGQPIGTATNYVMPALAVGEIKSVVVNVGKPLAGVHYTIRLDVGNHIPESNETNNVAAGNF